jgi:uncharacterized protein (TIGR00369 family)
MAETLPEIPFSPSAALLGAKLVAHDAAKGWVKLAFDGKAALLNAAGFVQPGLVSAMLDDSMAPALWLMTKGAYYPATTAMTVCFLEPVKPGPLFGEGRVVRYGNAVAFIEGRLTGANGRLLARATANAQLMPAQRAVA